MVVYLYNNYNQMNLNMLCESSLSDTNGWFFYSRPSRISSLVHYIMDVRINCIFFNRMKKNVKVVDNLCVCVMKITT